MPRIDGLDGLRAATAMIALLMALPSEVRASTAYHEVVLQNGLRVVLMEHHANPMVASSVVVGAGSMHEPPHLIGASHLLEHLLFNGTESRSQRELYDEVDRYGAYNNATTREDHTLFSLLIQKEFAPQGLAIQADMLFHSTLPPENFEKEKAIVLEEMARDDSDPDSLVAEEFRRFAWAGTPLGHPVLGTRASIEAAKREDVLAYYKARYVPSNMTLVLIGDFDTPAMLEVVRRTFGGEARSTAPAGPLGGWGTPAERNVLIKPSPSGRGSVRAAFPLRVSPHDPLFAAVELLLEALSSGEDSPLTRELTSGPDPAALSVGLHAVPRTAPWSSVELEAVLPEGKAWLPVLDGLARGLRTLADGEPRRRIDLVRSRTRAQEIVEADRIHYVVLMRSSFVAGSPPGFLDRVAQRFEAVTDAQLDQAAALLASALTEMRVLVAARGLAEASVRWNPVGQPVTAAVPPATAPLGRRVLSETLPNGLQLVAVSDPSSEVLGLHLLFRPRSASEPEEKGGIASFLHRLFPRATLLRDGPALSSALARVGATLKTDDDPAVPYDDDSTTSGFSFVRLEMPADDWREGVALLAELVRLPRLEPIDVETVRREMLDLQKRKWAAPRVRALARIEEILAPGHALARPVLGSPGSIASITPDDLRAFHQAYVSGRRMILTAVSPVDPADLMGVVRGAFGGLPAGHELPVPQAAPVTPVPGARDPVGPSADPSAQATLVLASLFDAPREAWPALAVTGALLSDRLTFALREQQGLAYSMGASIEPWAGRMRIRVTMDTRRENTGVALDALRRGISTFAPESDEEVRRAAAALRGRMLMRRLTRIHQAYALGLERMDGRAAEDDLARLDALLRVDAAAVREVVRRIDPARFVVVVE